MADIAEAPVEEATPTVEATPAPVSEAPAVPVAAKKRPRKLVLAAIIVGAVIVAGGLFGGGIAVGLAIPTGGPGQGQFGPGGQGGNFPGGDRPDMPNGNQGGQQGNNGSDDSDSGTSEG
jgi:hypothetical protein